MMVLFQHGGSALLLPSLQQHWLSVSGFVYTQQCCVPFAGAGVAPNSEGIVGGAGLAAKLFSTNCEVRWGWGRACVHECMPSSTLLVGV